MSSHNQVKLKSSDGKIFEVDKLVAYQSQTLKVMLEDKEADIAIPLPNVSGKTLYKVIEYCRYHMISQNWSAEELPRLEEWDARFVKDNIAMLYHLMLAADYLNIEHLVELTCKTLAHIITANPPEEIRRHFNIPNDFTPEEEEELKRENRQCL